MKLFHRRLGELVSQKRLSVSELAENCGVTRQTVYGWLRGSLPHRQNLHLLARVLGTSVEYLQGEENNIERSGLIDELGEICSRLPVRWVRALVNMARDLEDG